MTDEMINDATAPDAEDFAPSWGEDAPRGGKAVMTRILKDGAKVPLFLGQTLVNSLRDVGYDSTTSALCEHVDNAVQWGATEVRIYFSQSGQRGNYEVDALVYDNGAGMAPHVLKVATSFGGSMVYENRAGIGRYGVGMKAAALSMSPVLELYSWQEPGAIYSMTLDVNEISLNRANLIELSDPIFMDELPSEIHKILTRPMVYPKNPDSSQTLLTSDRERLDDSMGHSGTIVYMPNCDRLTYKKSQTLVDDAVKEMGRIYRRQIAEGVRLYVNNRRVEAFDPTYWMTTARHNKIESIGEYRSRLVNSWDNVQIPIEEGSHDSAPISIRLYMLPIESWYNLPRKTLRNDLQVFADHTISFMRNDREVKIGSMQAISGKLHADSVWMRIQIDFTGDLDEAFGVAMNKQGVRPKNYVIEIIRELIKADISKVRDATARYRADNAKSGSKATLSEAERRATESDAIQGKCLPQPAPQTAEEKLILENQLREFAVSLKRHDETDEEAYERVRKSNYATQFKHDQYWPFYHVDFRFGKVVLTINTAHAFFTKLYEPLANLAVTSASSTENGEEVQVVDEEISSLVTNLQLLLLSLARTQSQLTAGDGDGSKAQVFDTLRKEWSANYQTQLVG
ncbi:ATP-binding protein [Brevundimonas aveniformis]|uniref:ATP-binding protein n=1 Tax=Brevundimonas aveniformis TaxID=370977 RepID=UPI0024921F4B|nr:ATP-binding protein [Brevundimonas aveniformis]